MLCHSMALRRVSLLSVLPEQALESLAVLCQSKLTGHGDVLYRQGECCASIHLVCAGAVKLTCSTTRGRQRILTVVGPGQILGGEALLECSTRTQTASNLGSGMVVI